MGVNTHKKKFLNDAHHVTISDKSGKIKMSPILVYIFLPFSASFVIIFLLNVSLTLTGKPREIKKYLSKIQCIEQFTFNI